MDIATAKKYTGKKKSKSILSLASTRLNCYQYKWSKKCVLFSTFCSGACENMAWCSAKVVLKGVCYKSDSYTTLCVWWDFLVCTFHQETTEACTDLVTGSKHGRTAVILSCDLSALVQKIWTWTWSIFSPTASMPLFEATIWKKKKVYHFN